MNPILKKKKRKFRIKDDVLTLPNWLTMIRIIAIPIIAVLILIDTRITDFVATIVYSLAAITDFFDGYIARKKNLISVFGKFLDPLADKLVVLSILVVLLFLHRVDLWVVGVILSREITITGLRSIASSEGIIIQARPLGKFKTAFQMVALVGLILHHSYPINFLFGEYDINFHRMGIWLLYISIVFSLTSAVDYFIGFFRALKQKQDKN